jgi:hypothetical protein
MKVHLKSVERDFVAHRISVDAVCGSLWISFARTQSPLFFVNPTFLFDIGLIVGWE